MNNNHFHNRHPLPHRNGVRYAGNNFQQNHCIGTTEELTSLLSAANAYSYN